ncbi:MAG TPA: hypothetical protein VK681_39320 [Reyranella sp.]|nr:hypothetical protein [Reyranella sp.]
MRAYSIEHPGVSLTAAATTIIELTAAAAKCCIILRAWLSQQGNTSSNQQGIALARQSTAGTGVTAPTANPADGSDTAFGGTVRGLCTTQGTLGAVLFPDSFNWQNPWTYLGVPEERETVGGGGILALRTQTTPQALTVNSGLKLLEVG